VFKKAEAAGRSESIRHASAEFKSTRSCVYTSTYEQQDDFGVLVSAVTLGALIQERVVSLFVGFFSERPRVGTHVPVDTVLIRAHSLPLRSCPRYSQVAHTLHSGVSLFKVSCIRRTCMFVYVDLHSGGYEYFMYTE
jgi:hypothetical protein